MGQRLRIPLGRLARRAIWGTVTYLKAPELIRLTGPLGMQRPVHSVYSYELEENDGTTLVKLSHRIPTW